MKEHRTFNVNELFQELERNGRRHRWYFHYTTLDVMDKILANGMLFLSRVGKMNDGKEADTMPDNIFAACFSASGTESVAMWNTYGIPRRDAVRLCFDGCLVRKFLDGKFGVLKCHARNKDGIVIDEIPPEKVELKMFDVIYASTGGKHFQYREKHCTVTDENGKALNLLRGKFAGYAKMCGWSYEREVRLPHMAYEAGDERPGPEGGEGDPLQELKRPHGIPHGSGCSEVGGKAAGEAG